MRTVVFVEFPEDVDAAVASCDAESDATRVICLSPAAAARAAELGAPVSYPDAYADSFSLQAAGADHFVRVEALCDLLDGYVRESTAVDPVSVRMFFKSLKVLYDTVTLRILQVRAVLEAERPEEIVFFEAEESGFDDRLLFREHDSVFARIIPLCAKVACPMARVDRRRSAVPRQEPLVHRLKRAARALHAWYRGLARGPRGGAKVTICVVETGYGLDAVLPDLAQSAGLVFWRPPAHHAVAFGRGLIWAALTRLRGGGATSARGYVQAWRAADASSALRPWLERSGVEFYDVVRSRLRFLLTDMLPRAAILRAECERFLESRPDVRAVFSVNFSFDRPWTYVIALAARRRGVPVVTYQHSAFGYFFWPYSKYVDEVMSDYRLVWGPGSVRFMRDEDRTGCEPLMVGSLELQQLRRQMQQRKRPERGRPLIVYPIAGHTGNRFYFAHHRLTDTETFELTKSVIAVLGKATYADVVVKLYPGQSDHLQRATQAWLAARGWRHVHAVAGGNFSRLVADADLVVVDSPSTVLVQAVLGRSRLVVYTSVYRMVEAALAALRRRASVFSEKVEFLECLESIVARRDFDNAGYGSDEFAREYCGDPAADPGANVVNELSRIAMGRKRPECRAAGG